MVVCQVEYYPMRQEELSPALDRFWKTLDGRDGIEFSPGELETVVTGPKEAVFAALQDAWDAAHEEGPGAMEITVKEERQRDVAGWNVG